ncbi:MAG: hypothetical protein EBT97_02055 [Actinobacteria bacterium]|nr:hypothetical protein [Actinomycetota bacterium]
MRDVSCGSSMARNNLVRAAAISPFITLSVPELTALTPRSRSAASTDAPVDLLVTRTQMSPGPTFSVRPSLVMLIFSRISLTRRAVGLTTRFLLPTSPRSTMVSGLLPVMEEPGAPSLAVTGT